MGMGKTQLRICYVSILSSVPYGYSEASVPLEKVQKWQTFVCIGAGGEKSKVLIAFSDWGTVKLSHLSKKRE